LYKIADTIRSRELLERHREGMKYFNFEPILPSPRLISCRKMPKTENPYGKT